MPQHLPRIAKGFHLEVAIKISCVALIPFSAAVIAATRQQTLKEADILQNILTGLFLAGGVIFLIALPYFFIVLTPRCDSCKVRTRKAGRIECDQEEFITTTCPQCRETFRYRPFGHHSG